MKYHPWLKQCLILTDDLERAANARPYDPNAYNEIIDQLNSLENPSNRHKRRRPWGMILFIIALLLVLLQIILEVFFYS
ncbi:hypothetical protein LCGC14_1010860 [marine sediment metagenome]|uniref:Uncharacterized protein n=1 Tax=marine sediment metagenome TaxID=412755 RepID=A0A0F9R6D7_9ZZZZ